MYVRAELADASDHIEGEPARKPEIVAARQRIERLEMALDNMSQGLCMFDAHSHLIVWNRRYTELFGLDCDAIRAGMTQEEICSMLIRRGSYLPEVTIEAIRKSTQAALHEASSRSFLRPLADGRMLAVLYRSLPAGGWVSTFEDVTERRQSEVRIAHLACHDPITDLFNAGALRSGSSGLLSPGPQTPLLAAYYIDIDHFKLVNDTHGHDIGDELLRAVAERLRGITPYSARIGRLGADAFVILHRTGSMAATLALGRRLVADLRQPYLLSHGALDISVSIGLTTRTGIVEDLDPLLQEADFALREAKASGDGRIMPFDPALSEAARDRRALAADLQAALAAEQFEVHYQPLVNLDDQRIVGAEALLRWHHPERGMVSPTNFIPLAEETGFIVPLGLWVMRRACQEAAAWPDDITVAVNVSSMQMRHGGFAASVLDILTETGLAPRRLEIEITESVLLDESDDIMRNLHALRAAGIRFAMDDFGTGYSSLSYLRRFAFDKIKIDRSFMKDAETSADALAIIRAISGLGTSLGIITVIEGVETREGLALARNEGVRQVQGFLFSRPQPSAVIARLLRDGLPADV